MSDTQIIDNIHTKEQFMEELAKYGNMSSVSDLEVGARSLEL